MLDNTSNSAVLDDSWRHHRLRTPRCLGNFAAVLPEGAGLGADDDDEGAGFGAAFLPEGAGLGADDDDAERETFEDEDPPLSPN